MFSFDGMNPMLKAAIKVAVGEPRLIDCEIDNVRPCACGHTELHLYKIAEKHYMGCPACGVGVGGFGSLAITFDRWDIIQGGY